MRRTLSVCPSVCPSVPLSLPSVTSRHLANYNDSPGNSPGAAAPGINDANLLVYHYSGLVQPIGLVDYLSLKKSI